MPAYQIIWEHDISAGKDHSFIEKSSPTSAQTTTLLLQVLCPHRASRTPGGRKQTARPVHTTHCIYLKTLRKFTTSKAYCQFIPTIQICGQQLGFP